MYLYETHLHTCQGSACGRSTGAEHARFYKEQGYQGVFITDHFFGGNTAAPRQGSWEERIRRFAEGYEDAKAEGDRIGLDVFFGWEQGYQGDEYLVYGLSPEFLIANPDVECWSRREQYEHVRAAGGCVIQAHPFRMRDYIHAIHLGDALADGIEGANAGNTPAQDAYAMRYAMKHGLYTIAGSDNHRSHEGVTLYGVGLEERLTCPADWVRHVRERRPHALLCPADRWAAETAEEPLIRTFVSDAEGIEAEMAEGWEP